MEAKLNIGKARCVNCDRPMAVSRMACKDCELVLEGSFELPTLATLSLEDQIFVTAFVRHHGSIKKMEELFSISYPTVKNRLNSIGAALDSGLQVTPSNAVVLEQLGRGELSVDDALERIR